MSDVILIQGLELMVRVGVPDAERAVPQRLEADLTLHPRLWFSAMEDRIERTVNYHAVVCRVRDFVSASECRLLETLACDIATMLLTEFAVERVGIELRKFILPETRHVAVRIERPL